MNVVEPVATGVGDQPGVARIYGVVLSVGVACSLAIVSVHEATRGIIQRNQIAARQRAVLDLLPKAVESVTFRLDAAGGFREAPADAEGTDLIFAGFDGRRQLVGLAIPAQGMGYADYIRVLYGYSFTDGAIIGVRVLDSLETPGLGDRIEKDEAFLRNFERLDVSLDADGQLAQNIEFVKAGEKSAPWQIDGITGATISSRAIADMLAESAALWVPRVNARRTDFTDREAR